MNNIERHFYLFALISRDLQYSQAFFNIYIRHYFIFYLYIWECNRSFNYMPLYGLISLYILYYLYLIFILFYY